MRRLTWCSFKISSVTSPILVLACALAPPACRADDTKATEAELNRAYKDQLLILRNFYSGDHLRYNADGQLLGGGRSGYWTVDGEVKFDGIKLRRRNIEVDGTRIWLAYDQKGKQFGQIQPPGNHVRIEIDADPGALTLPQVQSLMAKVFLTKNEKLEDFVPAYWRKFLSGTSGPGASQPKEPSLPKEAETVQEFRPGHNVTAPVVLAHNEPSYTEEARRAKLNGTVVLWLIVNRDGKVASVQILRPVGLGLDDHAVETVMKWQFKPARRDGEPFPVLVSAEVSFRLY